MKTVNVVTDHSVGAIHYRGLGNKKQTVSCFSGSLLTCKFLLFITLSANIKTDPSETISLGLKKTRYSYSVHTSAVKVSIMPQPKCAVLLSLIGLFSFHSNQNNKQLIQLNGMRQKSILWWTQVNFIRKQIQVKN